ncbi:hypothetical protein [Hymenobacter ruricola]|uniref:Uncharacterized protein n=1 Tax=Hymenobacter ruricola TaxID=2791023 RepID=A0ABS0I910_9BACT|nr:hypothetical protein [Hymenobacter ruricola]MBF9223450.1 hypothetical protein [Hymenobacter ruricola]
MPSEITRKLAAERRQLAQLVRDTEHELRTNPDYQSYFAGYTPASVAAFIEAYAQRKARYVLHGPVQAQWRERHAAELHTEAYQRLWDIQQKKLFDLQCRWRAKEIDLPGVNIYQQFGEWEGHPERCEFLPPIEPDEVELYRAYLLSPECLDAADHYSDWRPDNWQNYADAHLTAEPDYDPDDFYADDEASQNNFHPGYLPWYRYHDRHHGTDMLALPDLRGARQKHYATLYLKAAHARQAAEKAAALGGAPVADTLPAVIAAIVADPAAPVPDPAAGHDRRTMWGHCDWDELFDEIAEAFDPTPRLRQLKQAMDAGLHHRDTDNDEVSNAFDVLMEAEELVPLEAGADDWRAALVTAATDLRKRWLAEALTTVYEQYRQRLALGLRPTPPAEHEGMSREDYEKHVLNVQREWVLGGRALCGEPQDFNY